MKKNKIWLYSLIPFSIALFFVLNAMLTRNCRYIFDFIDYGGVFNSDKLTIFGKHINLYWFMYLVGIIAMIVINIRRCSQYNYTKAFAFFSSLLLFIFGYIGAKLLYIIETLGNSTANGTSFSSGFSFYGAVFFIPIEVFLFCKVFKINFARYLDFLTPAIVIMLTFIRVGCFCSGCCGGVTYHLFSVNRPLVFPSQLVECGLDVLLLDRIIHYENENKFTGYRYSILLGGYGLLRFFVEITRDTPKDFLGMANGQWFSILSVILCIVILLLNKNKSNSKSSTQY